MMNDANRVAVTTATTGTGTVVCGAAMIGKRSFASAYGSSGNTEVPYVLEEDEGPGWEVGRGTYLGGSNALQRDQVFSSSAGGSKVNFPAGSKLLYVQMPAEGARTIRAQQASDIVLALRASAGQSAKILQTYNASGAAITAIHADGRLEPNAIGVDEYMRLPMDDSFGAYIGVRKDKVGGSAVSSCIRYRGTGTGTDHLVQWSQGDARWIQFRPAEAQIHATNSGATETGIHFAEGIFFDQTLAQIGGNGLAHIGFDCLGGSASTVWEVSPVNMTGSGQHTIRVGRFAGTNTIQRFQIVAPGTATPRITLSSEGPGYAFIGDFYIGAEPNGTPAAFISAVSGTVLRLRSGDSGGGSTNSLITFRDSANTTIGALLPPGTGIGTADGIVTREKGDARYQTSSTLRFKTDVHERTDLVDIFPLLHPKGFTWGNELSPSDERYGTEGVSFIAEEVESIFPEACRYVAQDPIDGAPQPSLLNGLDPLAILGVLHAKITEIETRLEAVET